MTSVKVPRVITIDCETEIIRRRPDYPPKPVSLAIKYPEKVAKYFAWGHPTKNNCTQQSVHIELRRVWRETGIDGLLFQNGKFDIDVLETHFGLPRLDWSFYHELQNLLFLNNPHSHNLQLKSQGKELLGIVPAEKDEAVEWLKAEAKRTKIDPRPWAEGKAPGEHAKPERVKWYAMVSLAPGDIVGKLAMADVTLTEKLFNYLYPRVCKC